MAKLKRTALAFVAAGGEIKQADNKKKLESAYVAAGGEINQSDDTNDLESMNVVTGGDIKGIDHHPFRTGQKRRISKAVEEYLADCRDRQGKSGYGLAVRTPETYQYRLGFLTAFKPEANMDEVNEEFIEAFRRFLLSPEKDLKDRTCYNIMQAVSTFLLKNGSSVAKSILKEMSYPPTEVIAYVYRGCVDGSRDSLRPGSGSPIRKRRRTGRSAKSIEGYHDRKSSPAQPPHYGSVRTYSRTDDRGRAAPAQRSEPLARQPGFDVRHVISFQIGLSPSLTSTADQTRGAYQELLRRIRELPGVEAADLSNIVPLSGADNGSPFWIGTKQPASLQEAPHALYFWTGPDYLKTMGISLLQGRFFTSTDQIGSGKVVVIDSVLAHTFFPGKNPVGQTLTVGHWGAARIVGVVGHVHHWGLDDSGTYNPRQIYIPPYQLPDAMVLTSFVLSS